MCVWNPCYLGGHVCEGQSDVNFKYNFSGALYLACSRQGLSPASPYSTLPPKPQKYHHKHMPTTHAAVSLGVGGIELRLTCLYSKPFTN